MNNEVNDIEKGYEALATAIIKQAVNDYEHGRDLMYKNIKGCTEYIQGQKLVNETKNFFHSQWFTQLSKADGPAMFKKIEENYNKYGKCMPFVKKESEA